MNAVTMRAYTIPDGEPLLSPIQCGSIKVPTGAYLCDFFLVTPQGTATDPTFFAEIQTEYSVTNPASNPVWRKGPGAGGPGEAERVSGHLAGSDPGTIQPDPSVQWDFIEESSIGCGFFNQVPGDGGVAVPLDQVWVRPKVVITAGNPSGVLVSLVAVARTIDGEALQFDLSTRGS